MIRLDSIIKVWCLILLFTACNESSSENAEGGKLLASVGSHHLYQSDFIKIHNETNPADSIALANGYIEQWIRRAVLIEEAETSLSSTIDIQKLVDDYKSSLLIDNYEQKYISERLDTSISKEQLEEEYENQKANFTIGEDHFKVNVAKIDARSKGIEGFFKRWKRGDWDKVKDYCDKTNSYCTLSDEWVSLTQLHENIPRKRFAKKKLKKGEVLQAYDNNYEYFVKIKDRVHEGDSPPLTYLADKLSKLILHKRKKRLQSKLESDLYARALASKKIKVYK